MRDRATVEAAFGELPAAFSPIDVLVNNAGLAVGLPADGVDLDDWDWWTQYQGFDVLHARLFAANGPNGYGHIVNLGRAGAILIRAAMWRHQTLRHRSIFAPIWWVRTFM